MMFRQSIALGACALIALLFAGHARAAGSDKQRESKILVAEMSDGLAVFEVFLPRSDANRKAVEHKVLDDAGSVIADQKFGTANGHYKISMIGSFVPGREYTFLVDGKYKLSFRFDPSS